MKFYLVAFGMVSSFTYTFNNVLVGSFVQAPTSDDQTQITFATAIKMADIWRVIDCGLFEIY